MIGSLRKHRLLLGATVVITAAAVVAAGAGADAAVVNPAKVLPSWKLGHLPKTKSVPVAGIASTHPHALTRLPAWLPPVTSWPAAGSATVTATTGAGTAAGHLPIAVAADASAKSTASPASRAVAVRLMSRADAERAGVQGLLWTMTQPATSGPLSMQVDYSAIADAFGGDYAARLRVVQLPACAVTTPTRPACQVQTPLSTSRNDTRTTRLTATTPATTGTSNTGSRTMVLAASAAPSSGDGTYTATSLAPSGSWAAGGNTGAFTYSYPITVPPSVGGKAPTIALSYDSSSVDGRNSATNSQASWIGDGWDYSPGFVERSYKSCSDDGQDKTVTDQCWAGDNATISVAGHSGTLVPTGSNNQWRLSDDDGSIVDEISVSSSSAFYNGMNAGTYWRLTANDGTQFFFGANHLPASAGGDGSDTSTNAAWGVPVFGDDSGEPCNAATFDASRCTQGYRWNLDFVIDPHTNIAVYRYATESNYYAAGTSHTRVSYTRGGYLTSISYGQLASDYVAKTTPAAQIVFGTTERCDTSGGFDCTAALTSANAAHWPDVPFDQICGSTGTCTNYAPSFFTRKALSSITTKVWDTSLATPAWSTVDTYTLSAPAFPDPGDPGQQGGKAKPALWLASISHIGSDIRAGGAATTALTTSFTGKALANRVNGISLANIPPINRYRLSGVTSETGSQTIVTYDDSTPCTRSNAPTEDNDTTRCFPVRWTPMGYTDPVLDWFAIYPVSRVSVSDSATSAAQGSPNQQTDYAYGTPAWHRDDNPLTPAKTRTWGVFRGFTSVTATAGTDPDPITKTVTYYLQGMGGDYNADGSHPATPDVVDDSGDHLTDANALAGFAYQSETYARNGGPLQTAKVNHPWMSAPTATQALTGVPDLVARYTGTDRVDIRQLKANGNWRVARTTTSYDQTTGLPTDVDDQGEIDNGDGTDGTTPEKCTHTDYATNTAKNMRTYPWQVIVNAGACGTAVGATTLAATHTYYDSSSTGGQITGKGNVTGTSKLRVITPATWTAATSMTYDAYGRITSGTDTIGRRTDTAYGTTTASAPTTLVASKYLPTFITTTTYPQGTDTSAHLATTWTSSVTLDPGRQLAVTATDLNGNVTSETSDGLGRLTQVWAPNHPKANNASSPSVKFAYAVSNTAYSAVTTSRLRDDNNYSVSIEIYDAMLQLRQKQQTPPTGERGTRLITDTSYDSHGWARSTNQAYYNTTSAPTTALVAPTGTVPGTTTNAYDGRGRILTSTFLSNAVAQWSTRTAYPGEDRVDLTPPDGGTATSTLSDVRGQTTALRQYSTATPGGSTGYDVTYYRYDAAGRQNKTVGPLAASADITSTPLVWTSMFDGLGDTTVATDPDAGTTTTTYNDAGLQVTTTDSGTQQDKIGFHYDALGRKDYSYINSGTTPKIATWSYDPPGGKGLSAGSSRYNAAGAQTYIDTIAGYTSTGQPTGETVTIPKSTYGNTADITYTTANTYTPVLDLPYTQKITDSATASLFGQATETFGLSYFAGGLPAASGGTDSYETNTYYDPHGRVRRAVAGVQPKQVAVTDAWDEPTGRLVNSTTEKQDANAAVDNTTYTYSASGRITSATNREDGGTTDATIDRQCFAYDYRQRLADAWTSNTATTPADPTSNDVGAVGTCDTNPAAPAHTGPAPYWQSYSYDLTGNRTGTTNRTIAADGTVTSTTQTTDLPYTSAATGASDGGPHAIKTDTTGATVTSYSYDAGKTTGSTTSVSGTVDATRARAYSWNVTGQVAQLTIGTGAQATQTSYDYDSSGGLVARSTGTGTNRVTTLYLAGDTLTLSDKGVATEADRTYAFPGGVTETRVATSGSNVVHYQCADPHGTGTTDITATTLTVTRRTFTPFGEARSTPVGPGWAGDRGYINGTQDPGSGLTNIGAREYSPNLGRFLSLDPVLNTADPESMNGYAYSDNNPVNTSDPTGLMLQSGGDDCSGSRCDGDGATKLTGGGSGSGTNTDNDGGCNGGRKACAGGTTTTTPHHGLYYWTGETLVRAPDQATFAAAYLIGKNSLAMNGAKKLDECVLSGVGGLACDLLSGQAGRVMCQQSGIVCGGEIDSIIIQMQNHIPLSPEEETSLAEADPIDVNLALNAGGNPGVISVRAEEADSEDIPDVIYREGAPNPGNLKPRPSDDGKLSFRDSLSNPIDSSGRPVLRPGKQYIGIDTSQLPPESVIMDNDPPGHVSVVGVSAEELKAAVIERGTFGK